MDLSRISLGFYLLKKIVVCKNDHMHSSIIIMIFLILAINLSSVSAYEDVIGFDKDSTPILSNCSRIMWFQDASEGYNSSPAFRSGPIRNGGVSCFGRFVDGPANLKFYWKLDQYARIGELSFKVDNDTIVLCRSLDWTPVSYAIASGMHWLSWEYRKQYSYPEFAGAGWIDDIQIVSDKPTYEKTATVFPSNDSIKVLQQDISRFDDRLSVIENNVSDLNESLSITIGNVNGHIKKIEENMSAIERDASDLNESFRIALSEVIEQIADIDNICAIISNASQNEINYSNLSWISERVIFISNKDANLTDVLLNNKNKVIILDDGVYYTNNLSITSDGAHLRSLRKWGAKIDAGNNSKGIVIDTTNNITLDSLIISNCTDGVHIENSSHCNIINNLIEDFSRIGIGIKKSNDSTIMNNRLSPRDNPTADGIIVENGFRNTFALNEINTGLLYNNSYMYSVRQSGENTIYLSDSGYIWEDYIPNNPSDEFWCQIWGSFCECHLNQTKEIINLSLSENIWIHP